MPANPNNSVGRGAEQISPANTVTLDELPLPYVEIDASGTVTRANRASIAPLPSKYGDLVGTMAWNLVATDEKDPSFAAYCTSLETGDAEPVVHRTIYDRTEAFRTYEIHRRLIRDAEGTPRHAVDVCGRDGSKEGAGRSAPQEY